MKINFDKIQKLVLLTIIFGIICRVIPHPPNFSPVTAIALFGGLNFSDKRVAYSVPLVILFLSDLILGISLINLFVYTGFITVVFLGTKIKSINFLHGIISDCRIGTICSKNYICFILKDFICFKIF